MMKTPAMMAKKVFALAVVGLCVLGTTSCSRDVEGAKRDHLARGDRYMNDKNVEAAIIEYRNAIQQDPRFGEAYHKLSLAFITQGNGDEALRAAVAAAEFMPDSHETQLEAASLLLLAGRFGDVKALAQRLLAKDANDVRARVLLGNATAGLKDVDAAIKEFEEAIRLDPQQSTIYASIATLKASQGDKDAAERTFKQAIEADPTSTISRLALAQFYWSTDRRADAERLLKEAHDLAPRDARVNVALGVFYQLVDRGTEAEPYLRTAAEIGKDPRLSVMLADYYSGQKRTAEAIKLLEPIADDKRYGALASVRLAALTDRDGHTDQAVAILDRALTAFPNDPTVLAAKADMLRAQNKLDEAAKVAEAAVAANALSPEAQIVRGRILLARGSRDQAAQAFNEAVRLNPRSATAKVELARMRVAEGASDAVALAMEATKAEPKNIAAQVTLARAHARHKDYDKAQTVLTDLLRTNQDLPGVHAQLGSLLALKRDAIGARAEFAKALQSDPLQLEAATGLTALDFAAGHRPEALARLDSMVARAPSNARLLLLAANAQAAASNFARAEDLAVKAIEADAGLIGGYSLLGRIYISQKRLDAARAQFETIAARQDRPIAALTVVGTIHMLQNHTAEAEAAFERVLKIDPKAGVAANNLAWMYLENGGSLDLALHLAGVAAMALPESPEVHDTLGWAYYKKGLMAEAIAALRRSLDLDPKNATTIYHLGLAYEKSGERDEARQILTRYLEVDPSSDRSADVRRRLQSLVP